MSKSGVYSVELESSSNSSRSSSSQIGFTAAACKHHCYYHLPSLTPIIIISWSLGTDLTFRLATLLKRWFLESAHYVSSLQEEREEGGGVINQQPCVMAYGLGYADTASIITTVMIIIIITTAPSLYYHNHGSK